MLGQIQLEKCRQRRRVQACKRGINLKIICQRAAQNERLARRISPRIAHWKPTTSSCKKNQPTFDNTTIPTYPTGVELPYKIRTVDDLTQEKHRGANSGSVNPNAIQIVYADFSGGLNTSTSVDDISEKQLAQAILLEIDQATGK